MRFLGCLALGVALACAATIAPTHADDETAVAATDHNASRITVTVMDDLRRAAQAVALEQPIVPPGDMPDGIDRPASAEAIFGDEILDLGGACDCGLCGDTACGCSCDATDDCGCDDSCGCGDCDCGCGDPSWRLLPHALFGFELRGWANGGYSPNDGNTPSNYNGPITFNDRDDGQFNQLYVSMERAIDTSCGWDIGGRVDALYGTDHIFTMARGLELQADLSNRWNRSAFYGVSMPQAYVEAGYNRLRVQAGHFYRFVGYETVTAPNNFFYSHSYMAQYAEPFTHTGVLASVDATDSFTLRSGVDRGWDNWEDDNNQLSILFGGTWDDGCGTSLAVNGTNGVEGSRVSGIDGDRTLYSIVGTYSASDRLTFALQHDHGVQNNAIALGQDAEWYGASAYMYYNINCAWMLGVRSEWFRDDDGFRVQGIRPGNPINGAQFAGDFYDVAVGLNYRGAGNLIIRTEVRYDWYDGAANAGAGGTRPFDDGSLNDQLTGGVDLIITF